MAAYGSLDAHQITVGPQDRIDSIATSLSCSIDDFAGCNPGVDLYNLCPGQVIVIPCNAVVPEHGCHPQHGSGYGEQHDTSYGYGHGDNQYSHTCGCHDGAPSQEEYVSQLHTARALFENAIKEHFNGPELLRCAFHDAGTHDMHTGQFGADGSLRFEREMNEPHNKGIHETVDIIYGIKEHVPLVSFADLFQLGAAVAVELAGGPAMPIRYGRVDCGQEGIPHQVMIPSPSTDNPVEEIRDKMYRMGFNDQDIVAIMGGHTYGRVHLENSGFGVEETVYTKNGPGERGGTSWTEDWLKFTNTYYIELLKHDSHDRRGPNMLITLPTDVALLQVSDWSQWVQVYAQDQERWWQDYSEAHTKMSEFGATWMHGQPISM